MKDFTEERKRVIAVILEMLVLCLGWALWSWSIFVAILAVIVFSLGAWTYYSRDPKTFPITVKGGLFVEFAAGIVSVWFMLNPVVAIVVALVLLALRYGRIETK